MTGDKLVGIIDVQVHEKPPEFARERDVAMAKLVDESAGEWVVIRLQVTNLAVGICTPPPMGGYLELWDYPSTTEGALDALRAWKRWPRRDAHTEAWIRHRAGPGLNIQRRNPRVEDFPPGQEPR